MLAKLHRMLVPVFFCLTGIVFAFHPTLFSAFRNLQTDFGDTRFVNYVLEHGYRWALRKPGHEDLWSPPFFYPAPDIAAYSEVLLSVMPFYAPWRLVGFMPDTSFQLWMLTVSVLNFLSMYLLLRRCFGLGGLASSAGSFLFAFGSPRITQLGHQQLLSQFYTVAMVYALFQIARHGEQGGRNPAIWIAVFFASVVLQLYACFYYGWFLGFALALACLWMLVFRVERRRLFEVIRINSRAVLVSGLASFLALTPLVNVYLSAAEQVGLRGFAETSTMLPRLKSWFHMGVNSWLYEWTAGLSLFQGLAMEHEHRIGIGLFTLLVASTGLYLNRKSFPIRLMIAISATLFLLVTVLPGGVVLWKYVFDYVPGAAALRAVSRVGVMMLLPFSIGLAVLIEKAKSRLGLTAAMIIALVSMVEQGRVTRAYDKDKTRSDVRELASAIGSGAELFFFSPLNGTLPGYKYHLDAMWAQLETGVPTVNGYSGKAPPGWGLADNRITRHADERRLDKFLTHWAKLNGRKKETIRWVKMPVQDCNRANCAQILSHTLPDNLIAGGETEVTISVKNTGAARWTNEGGYALVWRDPDEKNVWGRHRIELPNPVDPGNNVTFNFRIKAPDTPGEYYFQWAMSNRAGPFAEYGPYTRVRVRGRSVAVVCDRRSVVGSRWSVVGGQWSVAGGRWSVAGDRWSVVGGARQ